MSRAARREGLPPNGAGVVLRALRAANGGMVTYRLLEAALAGAGTGRGLRHAVSTARARIAPGERIVVVARLGYRLDGAP